MPGRHHVVVEVALLVIVVGLAAFGVSATVRATAWSLPAADAAPAPAAERPAVAPLDAYAVIAARDVFNPAPAGDGEPLDGLVLQGVGLHGERAHAVIEDTATHTQRLYAVGDELRGARVAAITWDRVTLARGGRELTLDVVRAPRDGAAAAPPPPADDAPARVAAAAPGVRRTGADAFLVDRRELAGAVDNMSGLMTQLRAVAEVADGRPIGFRLFQIADDSVFRRLGLENGDVVQRVNGKPVEDPATLLAFLQRLKSEPRVALDIVRSGAPRTLVYDLR